MGEGFDLGDGVEWVVDAFGCDPEALRDRARIDALLGLAVNELGLHPVGPRNVHAFPGHGGITAMQLLAESHLTAHTFPERRYAAFNLYCCRARPEWPWPERLRDRLGSDRVIVRRILRPGPAA